MQWKENRTNTPELNEAQWPDQFYEIPDPSIRFQLLREFLKLHPDSSEDQRRMEILEKRYPHEAKQDYTDAFMHTWLMILAEGKQSLNFLNRSSRTKDMKKHASELFLDQPDSAVTAEWRNFTSALIHLHADDRTYSSTIFGLIPLRDNGVASQIADEIQHATCIIPSRFGLKEQFAPLHTIMIAVFDEMIPDSSQYHFLFRDPE